MRRTSSHRTPPKKPAKTKRAATTSKRTPRAAKPLRMRVVVIGAGKVGAALAAALRARGAEVGLRAARRGLPARRIDADLLVLAVRDRDLSRWVSDLVEHRLVGKRTACVHVAGAVGIEPLVPLRPLCAGVAQMHPMISFAARKQPPELARGNVHVQGDPVAVARARRVARALGMSPRTIARLDTVGYHAAAAFVANGAAALAAMGSRLLELSGVPAATAPAMLGPLIRSVGDNVERIGFPGALTGPIRRGDASSVERHLRMLAERLPDAVPLYVAAGLAQLPLARALAEAPPEAFDAVEQVLRR